MNILESDSNIRKEAIQQALKEMGVSINKELLCLDTLFKITRDRNKSNPSPIQQILFNEFLEKENINKI